MRDGRGALAAWHAAAQMDGAAGRETLEARPPVESLDQHAEGRSSAFESLGGVRWPAQRHVDRRKLTASRLRNVEHWDRDERRPQRGRRCDDQDRAATLRPPFVAVPVFDVSQNARPSTSVGRHGAARAVGRRPRTRTRCCDPRRAGRAIRRAAWPPGFRDRRHHPSAPPHARPPARRDHRARAGARDPAHHALARRHDARADRDRGRRHQLHRHARPWPAVQGARVHRLAWRLGRARCSGR